MNCTVLAAKPISNPEKRRGVHRFFENPAHGLPGDLCKVHKASLGFLKRGVYLRSRAEMETIFRELSDLPST